MELVSGTGLVQPPFNLTESRILEFVIAGLLTPYDPILGPPYIADCLWRCEEYQRLRDLLKQYPTITKTATSDWKGPWAAWETKNELTWKLEELLPNNLNELLSSFYDVSEVNKLFKQIESTTTKQKIGFDTGVVTDKSKRQDQKDREAVEAWAWEYFQQFKQAPDTVPTLIDVVKIAQEELEAARSYDERTLQDWIRPFHPQYTPGKPGRKKGRKKSKK
jgi:hypothetical protein